MILVAVVTPLLIVMSGALDLLGLPVGGGWRPVKTA